MNLEALLSTSLDSSVKGVPRLRTPITVRDIPAMRWNLLSGDLPIPVATIDRRALLANSRWMRGFTQRHGVQICPHGKTTMAPQLFQLQLDDGAWGITVASVQQMTVCRRFGVDRVLMANQLVGEQEMRAVFHELNDDPRFEFYCLVDSPHNVRQLQRVTREFPLRRPLQVLLEGGTRGARAGCRSTDQAIEVAREVGECAPQLQLCGIEGFEGSIHEADPTHTEVRVNDFIDYLSALLERANGLRLFGDRRPILTLGGSIHFDLVATHPHVRTLLERCDVILRSGCYLTHDSVMLTESFRRTRARQPDLADPHDGLRPALNVWGRIQSRPEPGLVILNVGKRDVSYDVDLPVAEKWFRPGAHRAPLAMSESATATQINDQHLFLKVSPDSGLEIGDMIGLGISHPCTTFDKWKLLYVVDEGYDVVDGILTYF